MLQFILNDKIISTEAATGMTLLDFVRYEKNLKGTKIGCREGDCGACTVLIGEVKEGVMNYKSVTSCVTPLGNVAGKHVVSIEGLNMDDLSPVQQAMVDESGTQCGFCTVGFVVSFSALCFSNKPITYEDVIAGIDGNICRCTGYKSIERAAEKIYGHLKNKDVSNPVEWLVRNNFIPAYFSTIAQRLAKIEKNTITEGKVFVGGGTDLYVQKHEEMEESKITFLSDKNELKEIKIVENVCIIGGAVTAAELMDSTILADILPGLRKHLKLISSTQIRNIGTVAGNFVNASPIGDLTAIFLALNSSIVIVNKVGGRRKIYLKDFYKGYKEIDKTADEIIAEIHFSVTNWQFNFEKVSKRTYLDIASVNTGISIRTENNNIAGIHISAGGVGPTPKYLDKTGEYLLGKPVSIETIRQSIPLLMKEISPISDARGKREYKQILLQQLYFSHFVELFPETFKEEVLL